MLKCHNHYLNLSISQLSSVRSTISAVHAIKNKLSSFQSETGCRYRKTISVQIIMEKNIGKASLTVANSNMQAGFCLYFERTELNTRKTLAAKITSSKQKDYPSYSPTE